MLGARSMEAARSTRRSRWIAAVLAGLLGAALLHGCGARSDIGQPAPAAGGGGHGGGTAATALDGGPDGVGEDAAHDAPDDAADAADGGKSQLETILEACTVASSCAASTTPGWPVFTPSACVDAFGRLGWSYSGPGGLPDPAIASRLSACVASADCAAFRACFGGGWVDLSRCREGGQCNGNAIASGLPDGASFDCGVIGAMCVDLWSNAIRACCNAKPCPAPSDIICNGTVASFCGGWGEYVDFDCGLSGRVCQPDPFAPCAGTGAPCKNDAPVTCAGQVATYCSGGALATQDCTVTISRTACAAGDSPWMPCRPQASECDPQSDLGQCKGTDLYVCVDGARVPVSCTKLGFSGCIAPESGYARCVGL